jgi:hypothetical protein
VTVAHTFWTDSHRPLLDHFLRTWTDTQTIPLTVHRFPQECKSGAFMSQGWNATMLRKVALILESLESPRPFWHLDCDLRFYRQLPDDFDGYDLVLQQDKEGPCAGLFWCRPTSTMKALWVKVAQMVERGEAANDQIALWHCLRAVNPERVGMLPSTFWTHGQLAGQLYPCELSAAQVPLGIFVHHCNYAVGVAAKVALGNEVEDMVYGRSK